MSLRQLAVVTALLLFVRLGLCYAEVPSDAYYTAIRNENLTDLRKLLASSEPHISDEKGATPLMYAAANGSLEAMRILLKAGADPNSHNAFGETALLWCAGDEKKVRLLLAHHADPKARSKQGRTPLYIAAAKDGNTETVKLLLAAGADPMVRDSMQSTPLAAAIGANDITTAKLLLSRGADAKSKDALGWTPLMSAAANNNAAMIHLLLAQGADPNAVTAKEIAPPVKHGAIGLGLETPLLLAAAGSNADAIRTLLDAGASVDSQDVRGMTALMVAVATDHADPSVIRLLLRHGASPKHKDNGGEDVCDWALKFNSPGILEALHMEPAKPMEIAEPATNGARRPLEAAELGIALLQSTSKTFTAEGGCTSCHSHHVTALAIEAAHGKGLRLNSEAWAGAAKTTEMMWAYFAPMLMQRMDPPGGAEMLGYGLLDMAANQLPAGRTTDAMVHNLLASQHKEGNWHFGGIARPPMSDGDFTRTALAIRTLARYAPKGRAPEVARAIAAAANWLQSAVPVTTEDWDMQLLGLKWAGVGRSRMESSLESLLRQQHPNGGWSQTPNLPGDAYATAQALYTLHELGRPAPDPVFRKGVGFLLRTQNGDGSWLVKSRAAALQPYFESGFPHGRDQWISSAATAWATLVLTCAGPDEISAKSHR